MHSHTHTHTHTHTNVQIQLQILGTPGTHTRQDTHICTLKAQRAPYGILRPPLPDTPGSTHSLTWGPIPPEVSPSQMPPITPLWTPPQLLLTMAHIKPQNHSFSLVSLKTLRPTSRSDRQICGNPSKSSATPSRAHTQTHTHTLQTHTHTAVTDIPRKSETPAQLAGLLETTTHSHKRADSDSQSSRQQTPQADIDIQTHRHTHTH